MSQHDLAEYVRILARGKHGSRHMTYDEAYFFMQNMLKGNYHPAQMGAVFMLLRVMEEEPQEIAGFAAAINELWPSAAQNYHLIWSSYAGKRRQPMWSMLSAHLLSTMGYRILVHGTEAHTQNRVYAHEVFDFFGWHKIEKDEDWDSESHLTYLPCSRLHEELQAWLSMKSILGVRSPINTVLKVIAPASVPSVQGIFHPTYRDLHIAACELNTTAACVIKGEGGEFEVNPERTCVAQHTKGTPSTSYTTKIPNKESVYLEKVADTSSGHLVDVWNGVRECAYAEQAILHTAALALMTINSTYEFADALVACEKEWACRQTLHVDS